MQFPDPKETAVWVLRVLRDAGRLARATMAELDADERAERNAPGSDDVIRLSGDEALRELFRQHGIQVDAPRGRPTGEAKSDDPAARPTTAPAAERRRRRRRRRNGEDDEQ